MKQMLEIPEVPLLLFEQMLMLVVIEAMFRLKDW